MTDQPDDTDVEPEASGKPTTGEGEVRIWYDPRRDRELSDAVLSAIETATDADLEKDDCDLFDAVDPEALDDLFTESSIETSVQFNTPTTGIRITPGNTFEIRVASLEGGG
ncbi:HalOD1 output domain-containing protein [Natrarchaeobaculum aegyptiacum]|uniref:Halobacterial output domain-containing protein n=1 Tax=Natrarchaeobaculum aegyptiacum TaxID=745377 RepID=A0A2Z2HRC3_9EURY|nr:HalOD1 output domain-containing protein [Natrarchaeobaculum aegyptiacum]ARS89711.1 hypothetical protein B1756_08140 [Natrarchaeobaculum aegyptiacum]